MRRPLLVFVLAGLLLAAPAAAHGPDLEETNLGPEHAAEHRAERAQMEAWERLSPAKRRAIEHQRARAAVKARAARAEDPAVDGQWSGPFPHRAFGMHAVLLPTGKVLYWSLPTVPFGSEPNEGWAWLWDPSKGTGAASLTDIDPPLVDADGDGDKEKAPLYCSGQSLLPDGRVLITGGNKKWLTNGSYSGWEGVLTFNPWTEKWTVQDQQMSHGRWYPSQVLTGDGRTLIMAGTDETGDDANKTIDVFTPDPDMDGSGGKIQRLGTAEFPFEYYPWLFPLPNGDILHAGPGGWETALIDPETGERSWDLGPWPALNVKQRLGGTAVLRPAGPAGQDVVTAIGGTPHDEENTDRWPATKTTETLDMSPADGAPPAWKFDAPLNVARSYHNTVLLPDGGMVTVGGAQGMGAGKGNRWNYENGEARPVELLAPGATQWRLGAAQAEDRGYHSIAMLLPDGRVLSAGDDVDWHGDTFEIYKPPYLFNADGTPSDRPAVTSAPSTLAFDEPFDIGTSGDATKAVLIAPSSVTHSVNMSQRFVELALTPRGDGKLATRAPATGNVAPPGWYMLFVLNAKGVPSVAKWVKLGGTWTPPPPDADPDPDPKPDPGTQTTPTPVPPAPPVTPGPIASTTTPTPPAPPAPRPRVDRTVPKATMRALTAADRAALRRTGRVAVRIVLGERAKVEGSLRLEGSQRTVLAKVASRWQDRGARNVRFVVRSRSALARGRKLRLSVVVSDRAGNRRTLAATFRVP